MNEHERDLDRELMDLFDQIEMLLGEVRDRIKPEHDDGD